MVTAITVFSTGQPVNLRGPNQTGSPFITPLPDRVCDGRNDQLSGTVRNNGFLWFDTACFPSPRVGYFGNSGPTVLNGPGSITGTWALRSLSLSRHGGRLQFRAEMFNAWNHAQFLQPNGDSGAGAELRPHFCNSATSADSTRSQAALVDRASSRRVRKLPAQQPQCASAGYLISCLSLTRAWGMAAYHDSERKAAIREQAQFLTNKARRSTLTGCRL